MSNLNITFLGLGTMGYPMAGYLSKAGYKVSVYNRTKSKSDSWVSNYSGKAFDTPRDAVINADVVFACVGNDKDIRDICLGDNGAFGSMKNGSIFVDHTTASANIARELNSIARDRGLSFIDAPVSGGQAGAENGKLTVMAGGNEEVFNKVKRCY